MHARPVIYTGICLCSSGISEPSPVPVPDHPSAKHSPHPSSTLGQWPWLLQEQFSHNVYSLPLAGVCKSSSIETEDEAP